MHFRQLTGAQTVRQKVVEEIFFEENKILGETLYPLFKDVLYPLFTRFGFTLLSSKLILRLQFFSVTIKILKKLVRS